MFLLLAAVACLVVWLVFTFVVPAGLGVVHALLGLGVALLVRWWVLARSRPVS
jgi:hypothetical protein